jgi:hypothetical protein
MAAVAETRRMVVQSPAFGCYLLALALLPFRWLSPLGDFYENSQWTDVLVAAAGLLWLIERIRDRDLARAFRLWQAPLAIYLALACASAVFAEPGFGGSWKTVLLMTELAVLAVITADFAAEPSSRRLIARVVVASALATVGLGAIAVLLFYGGVETGLLGGHGAQLPDYDFYTRVQGGFTSPPLLASFCIFASGVAASKDADLDHRLQVTTQIGLGVLCLATVSRGFIGFLLAALIRLSAEMRGPRRALLPIAGAAVSLALLAELTAGNRHEAFSTSLMTLGDHLLFGVGPGALPGVNHLGAPFRAHFTPLNVAATLGLPALVALGATFWLLWRDRARPTDIALWSALAGIAIDGLANDIDHYRHLWILIGLLGSGGHARPSR